MDAGGRREAREQIRCRHGACPSRRNGPGRVILERGLDSGWYYKAVGKVNGVVVEAILTMPVVFPCESCGRPWINPLVAAFDGMARQSQAQLMARAEEESAPEAVRPFRRRAA